MSDTVKFELTEKEADALFLALYAAPMNVALPIVAMLNDRVNGQRSAVKITGGTDAV